MKKDELTEILDWSLQAKPGYQLPAEFAQKVTASVARREQWKTDLQEYLYLTAILIGVVTIIPGIYYFLDKALLIRTINYLVSNWVLAAFLIFTVNFILFVDKVLLRLLFSRWRTN